MKKVSCFVLSLFFVFALVSCGSAHSSPNDACRAAAEAFFVNFDADAYFEMDLNYNLDLVYEYVEDEAQIKKIEKAVKANQSTLRSEIADLELQYGGREVKIGDSITSYTYKKGSESFDEYMEDFYYNSTSMESLVEEIAEVKYTLMLDGESAKSTMIAYKIDGNWYIGH